MDWGIISAIGTLLICLVTGFGWVLNRIEALKQDLLLLRSNDMAHIQTQLTEVRNYIFKKE